MKDCVYVGVQGSYKSFEIALFQDGLLAVVGGDGVQASSQFLIYFQKLLHDNQKDFSDVQFIAVDQGPGAFTSLRVIIASVNALAFDKNVALVGVDGLDALARQTWEMVSEGDRVQVSLLNAYNNEVYYAVHQNRSLVMQKGYKKIEQFLEELVKTCPGQRFLFAGNGAALHNELIGQVLGERASFVAIPFCSAQMVGTMGREYWEKQENIYSELKPLYLKAQTFAVKS